MTISVNITQSNVFTALRSFLLSILPNTVEVFQAQTNRVAEPIGNDFVVMTPIFRERIEWNTTTFTDGYPSSPSIRQDLQPTRITIQLDFHGPNSGDYVQTFTNLFFSGYAYDQFSTGSYDIHPLYHSDPHQSPFLNGEQQIEQRWVVDAVLQSNEITTESQQFADEVEVNVISVEERYPIE